MSATFTLDGTLRGTGGAILANAPVHVFAASGGTYLTSVLTNGSGHYAFTLPAGSYKLWIQAPGYPDQWHGAATYEGATPITLGPSKTVDVTVSATFTLDGTLRGTAGASLANARTSSPPAGGRTSRASSPTAAATTPSPSPPAPTSSGSRPRGYPDQWHGAATYEGATHHHPRPQQDRRRHRERHLHPRRHAAGHPPGRPSPTPPCTSSPPAAARYLTSVLTNGAGHYAFTLPAGSYKLWIQAPGYPDQWHGAATYEGASTITLGPSKTVDVNVSATFTLDGTLRGTAGAILANAPVHAFTASGGTYLTSVLTNGSGHYAFTLPAGSYKLWIQAPGYPDQWHGAATYEGASTITLGPSKTVDVNVSATP